MAGRNQGYRPPRAPYAADPAASRGRLYREPASPTRTPFQRDGDRITHSTAFRRLRDKTQVFLAGEGDHFRTRLTHTLEVARIARTLARTLCLDEDLAEAVALAHDLGHTPFGHAGERALDASMAPYGGFDHNAQSLRIVTLLERRYPRFDGLNLTWEVLEGIAKHNGPLADRSGAPLPSGQPANLELFACGQDLWLWSYPSLEAQLAAVADDIAYAAHDIDDGARASLLALHDLDGLELVGGIVRGIASEHPGLERPRFAYELSRRLLTALIDDVVAETRRRVAELNPDSSDDVRNAGRALAAFSDRVAAANRDLQAYLARAVYRHPSVLDVMRKGEAAVRRLFERYFADPGSLPPEWRADMDRLSERDRARRVADFLAGQTESFARLEYRRLFDEVPEFG
jgi:dGTPase